MADPRMQSAPPTIRQHRLQTMTSDLEDLAGTFSGTLTLENANSTLEHRAQGARTIAARHEDLMKRDNGIKGLLRRASISMKGNFIHIPHNLKRPATPSLTTPAIAENPLTPWQKLRKRSHLAFGKGNADGTSFEETSARIRVKPTPGYGNAPPVIPRGLGGSAARATAAAQNEHLERSRSIGQLIFDDGHGDYESAVELALPTSVKEAVPVSESPISAVDFIRELPVELAYQILCHLDHRGLARAEQVSTVWARVGEASHVWREAFYREKSGTFAMGGPVLPGTGLGIPSTYPEKHFKDVYRVRQQLEQKWEQGLNVPIYLNGHLDSIYCVQFDEDKIISGSRDKTIRIWDIRTYACKLVIGPKAVVDATETMLSGDRRPIHYASLDNGHLTAVVCPLTATFPMHHNASILCLQYDDDILVTGSSDATCIIHDMKNGYEPILQLRHHTAAVLDLAFDKKHIVTCSKDTTICVWDRKTGAMLKQLGGHSGPVNAVQLRGNTIVSCSGDFKVKLWNIDTGKNIREFVGHTKGLACSQFSEDGKYIASAGNDKVIRIWDANTGECLRQMEAHDNLVRSLHVDSISGRLISGSYDQDIKVFDMEDGRQLLDFPKWHASWVLGAKSDYRRLISTGQDPKILIMDFGKGIKGIELLESTVSPW